MTEASLIHIKIPLSPPIDLKVKLSRSHIPYLLISSVPLIGMKQFLLHALQKAGAEFVLVRRATSTMSNENIIREISEAIFLKSDKGSIDEKRGLEEGDR